MNSERRLTILTIGAVTVVALIGAITLAALGKDYSLFLAIVTGGIGILTPSPLSKTSVAVDQVR